MTNDIAKYDREATYQWNYEHAPVGSESEQKPAGKDATNTSSNRDWRFCGLIASGPLGVAAGPLLNRHWLLHYAELGFDVLTYKTVRSRQRECYALPNLQPIHEHSVRSYQSVLASDSMHGSWAISFGMPSKSPDEWRPDVEQARRCLAPEKLLSVSVVATAEPDWSVEQVAADYAQCAYWAAECGADTVEVNFSCPNVDSVDGQLYQDIDASRLVLQSVRQRVPDKPLIVKIGVVESRDQIAAIVQAWSGLATAISMTNCIPCTVNAGTQALFEGQPRGIGGDAIRDHSVSQVKAFSDQIEVSNSTLTLIGVGGISHGTHVEQYLKAGAESVQLATAPMIDPHVALKIREQFGC